MSRMIAVWSPSGAGATTLLLNIASALGSRGLQVAAADLNLTTPSLGLYADLLPHDAPSNLCLSRLLPAMSGGRLTYDMLSRLMVPGPGFMLLPGVLDAVAANRLTEGQVQQVLRLLLPRFDLLLVDVPPALDSIGCLPVLELADLVLLVVGPDLASRFHTRRLALPLLGMGWEQKTALVLNRAGGISEGRVAEDIGLPVSAALPELKQMANLIESGQIAYDMPTILPAAARFRQAVERLVGVVMAGQGR